MLAHMHAARPNRRLRARPRARAVDAGLRALPVLVHGRTPPGGGVVGCGRQTTQGYIASSIFHGLGAFA